MDGKTLEGKILANQELRSIHQICEYFPPPTFHAIRYMYHNSGNHHDLKHIINNKRPYGQLQLASTYYKRCLYNQILHNHNWKGDAHLE